MSGRPLALGDTDPWSGGSIGSDATCILAPNPGPMTLDGTNTWILGPVDSADVIVVDPGPDDDVHLQRILRHLDQRGARVFATLLTHGHSDHSAAARNWHELTGAPVLALDPLHQFGAEGLGAGDVISVGEVSVRVVATPGHSADSMSFLMNNKILTGDTVLGRGTTVVAWPDGNLQSYLESLSVLTELIDSSGATTLLPGHGPALDEPANVIAAYTAHRHDRLDQVRRAVAAGAQTATEVVAMVYTDIPEAVRPAAELSAQAQLDFLRSR